MKSKKIMAVLLATTFCLAGAACGKQPVATSPDDTIVSESETSQDASTPSEMIDESDVENPTLEESDTVPYAMVDFNGDAVNVEAQGAEILTAAVDSDYGTYRCEYANYAKGSTVRVNITAPEEYQTLDYYIVFTKTQNDMNSVQIASATAQKSDDGTFVIEFTDEQEDNGVYFINISNDEGHAFVSVSVGYTADTINDYFVVEPTTLNVPDGATGTPADTTDATETTETTVEE